MLLNQITRDYKKAENKVLFLDYDGTLVELKSSPELAVPGKKLMELLKVFMDSGQTRVIIITGRSYLDMDRFFGNFPVEIIAEHGAMKKVNGKWEMLSKEMITWKKNISLLFHQIGETCPGSFIEEKEFSIAWHYRNADPILSHKLSRDLIDKLDLNNYSGEYKILDGHKLIEVMSKNIGKGNEVETIIKKNDYDFILSIGDDKTDEDMFQKLSSIEKGYTIKVGEGLTQAKYRLKNVEEVLQFLKQLLTKKED